VEEAVNQNVRRAVEKAVNDAVNWAVCRAVEKAVNQNVSWAVSRDVRRAAGEAVRGLGEDDGVGFSVYSAVNDVVVKAARTPKLESGPGQGAT
jgi:uncharacterized protein (UPF0147 family)